MTFQQSIKTCFKNYFKFSGRATRSEYWFFCLFVSLISVFLHIIPLFSEIIGGIISLLLIAFILIPSFSVQARRLHDINRSGWWGAFFVTLGVIAEFQFTHLGLIPSIIFGYLPMLPLIIWSTLKGSPEDNRFGPPVS